MYVGIIGLALPIGVISSNFADVYAEHMEKMEADANAEAAAAETEDLDVPASLSLKQKPVKQITVQPAAVPAGKIGVVEDTDIPSKGANGLTLSNSFGSIPASIAMLQTKFQELNDIKREWDEVMGEVEEILM